MKYLKGYKLFESINEAEIHSLCKKYGIVNYTINEDGSIDVDGDVNLSWKGLTEIPLKFSKIGGSFYSYNNQLTSLEGAPKKVGGNFDCSDNQLTSLEGAPKEVAGVFYCYDNKIKNIKSLLWKSFKNIDLEFNPIYEIVKDWINFDDSEYLIEYFLDLNVIQEGEGKPKLILPRLEAFYEDLGLEMNINFEEVKKYYQIIE